GVPHLQWDPHCRLRNPDGSSTLGGAPLPHLADWSLLALLRPPPPRDGLPRPRGLVQKPEPQTRSLVDPFFPSLPFPVAQHELLDLPRRCLRQVAELHGGRRLEARDVLLAEGDDLRLRRLLPGLEGDEGLGPLPPFLVADRHPLTPPTARPPPSPFTPPPSP